MKLNIFDRLLVLLSMIFMFCCGAVLIVISTGFVTIEGTVARISSYVSNSYGNAFYLISGIVIVLVAIRLMVASLSFKKSKKVEEKETATDSILIQDAEGTNGEVLISTEVIKDMAVNYANESEDVKSVDCKIFKNEEGIKIVLKLCFEEGVELKETMSTMQTEVKEYIEKYAGVSISSVNICADLGENGNAGIPFLKSRVR